MPSGSANLAATAALTATGAATTPPAALSTYGAVEWRFVLVNQHLGEPISVITNLAASVEFLWQLNRPTMLTFTVPSDDPNINGTWTDGLPYLAIGQRWILGYRKTSPPLDPTSPWRLQFAGRVWQLEDTSDGTSVQTVVTCFDALKHAEKRMVRDHAGNFNKTVIFADTPGTLVIHKMINRAQIAEGLMHIRLTGTFVDSQNLNLAYDQAYVLPEVINICDTGTCDLYVNYLDGTGDPSNAPFLQLGAVPRAGSDKPGVILGFAAPPRYASAFDRTKSMDDIANIITLYGDAVSSGVTSAVSDLTGAYGNFEDASIVTGVKTQALLDALAAEQLALRKNAQDMVTILPTPENSPRFFDDYFLGDTITVNASKSTDLVTREVVTGKQRVYGVQLQIDEQFGEHVTQMIVSSQAESS